MVQDESVGAFDTDEKRQKSDIEKTKEGCHERMC